MKRISLRFAALMAAMMMTMMTFAQSNDSIISAGAPIPELRSPTRSLSRSLSTDSTMWFNQTQELSGVVVKGRLPKTRVKGDAMRTRVAGTYQYGGSLNNNFVTAALVLARSRRRECDEIFVSFCNNL